MPISLTRLAALMIGTSLVPLGALAQELPADPMVVSGAVTVGTPGPGRLEIGQTSAYGILDWGSFGIGEGAAVAFLNGSGATLNRVTGGAPSALLGTLSATGSVYLVNSAGVVIGRDGVVDTGGRFVASTLDVAAGDFLDGGDLTFAGDSAALVVNFGQVGSSGGDVALIARTVRNAGTITAPQGTVGLISGTQVLMRDATVEEGLFSVILGAEGGEVTEAGTIRAAAAELRAKGGNVYALAGNTDHVIAATGVEKVAGRIFLTAEGGKVEAAKPVSAKASGGSGGTITVTGTVVDLAGSLDASGSLGGRVVVKAVDEADFSGMITTLGGGFVELSGGHITYDGRIDQGGGTLLIDPHNIEVSSANDATLTNATLLTPGEIFDWLSTGDVILDTTSADTGDAGTIRIFDPVFWSTDSSLTLLATGDVWILASVQTAGAGDITVVAGWDGATGEDSVGGIDTAVLDAEDLATTTAFGQANGIDYVDFSSAAAGDITPGTAGGNVFIGDISAANGTSVGSASGATRVYGSSVVLAAGADGAFAQIGYHPTGGTDYGTISGDLGLRATGSLYMLGGTGYDSYAMIGNGGTQIGAEDIATANISGRISVETAGDLSLQADDADDFGGSDAIIGHGGLDWMLEGDRSGAIALTVGGELSLVPGANGETRIGHYTGFGTISGADVTVTAGAMDLSADAATESEADVFMWADVTHGGDVRLTVTSGDLRLTGSTTFVDTEGRSMTSEGDFIVSTQGAVILDESFQFGNDGAGALVLAGSRIENEAGSEAFLDVGGGWSVYTTRPEDDSGMEGITPDATTYGVSYAPSDPRGPSAEAGNVFYYSILDPATPVSPPRAVPPEVAFTPASLTEEPSDPEPAFNNGVLEVIDTETTARILEEIRAGSNFCREFVGPEYAIDCLSDRLQSVADGISATGEYSEVRAALEDAAGRLHDIATENASAALSRSLARATDGSGRTSGRPLTAVDPAALAGANAAASAIIAETQLVLLRSTANSERRRVAFTQVGQVLGSTVVLLRS